MSVSVQVHLNHSISILALGIVDRRPPSTWEMGGSRAEGPLGSKHGRLWYVSELLMDSRVQWSGRVTVSQPADCWLMLTKCGSVSQHGSVQTPHPQLIQCVLVIRESFTREYGSRVFHSGPCRPLFTHFELNQLSLITRTHCTLIERTLGFSAIHWLESRVSAKCHLCEIVA